MLSPLDGEKYPLTHHNSSNRTSLLLDNFQGGFVFIFWCLSCPTFIYFILFLSFLGPLPLQMEIPRLGVEWEM